MTYSAQKTAKGRSVFSTRFRFRARLRLMRWRVAKKEYWHALLSLPGTTRFAVLVFIAIFVGWMVFLVSPKKDGTLLGNYTMRPPGWEKNR